MREPRLTSEQLMYVLLALIVTTGVVTGVIWGMTIVGNHGGFH